MSGVGVVAEVSVAAAPTDVRNFVDQRARCGVRVAKELCSAADPGGVAGSRRALVVEGGLEGVGRVLEIGNAGRTADVRCILANVVDGSGASGCGIVNHGPCADTGNDLAARLLALPAWLVVDRGRAGGGRIEQIDAPIRVVGAVAGAALDIECASGSGRRVVKIDPGAVELVVVVGRRVFRYAIAAVT